MEPVRITSSVIVPPEELELRYSRSGGPGGQNVNKRSTRVELVWNLENSAALSDSQRARARERLASRLDSRGRVRIVASEERTQGLNRERAVERFRELLADALRVRRPRRPTNPSRASEERRLAAKKVRSRVKRERGWSSDAE